MNQGFLIIVFVDDWLLRLNYFMNLLKCHYFILAWALSATIIDHLTGSVIRQSVQLIYLTLDRWTVVGTIGYIRRCVTPIKFNRNAPSRVIMEIFNLFHIKSWLMRAGMILLLDHYSVIDPFPGSAVFSAVIFKPRNFVRKDEWTESH